MSDRGAFALAVAVWAGALAPVALPWAVPAALVVLALLLRRPVALVAAAALLAAALAWVAWSGLDDVPQGAVAGAAVLVRDPDPVGGAVRVEVRVGGRHAEAWASGEAATRLRPRLAGEVVAVVGRWRPLSDRSRRWLRPRHVVARIDVHALEPLGAGSVAARAANGLRRTLMQGAAHLPQERRSLLLGVVLGDDREQPEALVDDFRAAGLSHLTAVSGQNLAFVLVLAAPILRRLGLRWRWGVTLALLAGFGLLTRWEPSVIRAGAMAALAATTATMGRPASRVRLLSLAVAAVVLLDPLLVHAAGFQLSVGATAGIALLAGPLARRLPELLAVTLAAQIGVAPVAIPLFGGLPLASLPANLLAGPVAAPLTVWGLTAGVAAGVLGPPFDRLLHLPTSLLTSWLAGVARWAAGLGAPEVALVLVVSGVAWWLGSGRWSWRSDRTASTSPPGPS